MQVKPDKPPPASLKFGAGSNYTRLDALADMMGTTERGVRTLLAALSLPIVHFPGMAESHYVLTYALESALFTLGMPKSLREDPGLLRVHQELAGVLYGGLTKEALRERVRALIKGLTSKDKRGTINKRRPRSSYRKWAGRTPSH